MEEEGGGWGKREEVGGRGRRLGEEGGVWGRGRRLGEEGGGWGKREGEQKKNKDRGKDGKSEQTKYTQYFCLRLTRVAGQAIS